VVHHALHDNIEPKLDAVFIHDSFACRNGKGTHRALDRTQTFLRKYRYFVHLDVKKYFPSIDHLVLKRLLRRRIADTRALWLCEHIIDSGILGVRPRVAERLPLFGAHGTPKGLPIGNLTSQFFANLYLNELDQYVKHTLKCRGYLRYMDDFALFGNDRRALRAQAYKVHTFCRHHLHLTLHEKGGVKHHSEGLPFLGFRNYRFKQLLKGPAVTRFYRRTKHRVKQLTHAEIELSSFLSGLSSWETHAKQGTTRGLRLHFSHKYRNLGMGIWQRG
jgi:retron-type reverse transcriptase